MDKYSVIDIETTGSRKYGHKITEVAIINIDGDEVVEEFSTLIDPEREIPFHIQRLTGISNEMVIGKPKFYEVAKKIVEMTEDRIFVAHNVFFDYNFIQHEFSELGFQYNRKKACTVKMARKYLPGHKSYSLGKICKDLDIKIEGRHRAWGDARATVSLLSLIRKQGKIEVVQKKQLALPAGLDHSDLESIPNTIGVYYFYGANGELLYVGKSKDLAKRVRTHFRPDLKRKKDIELKSQIVRIEFKVLPHELFALLFECHEIKTKRPIYNRALRGKRFLYAVDLKENKNGFKELYSRTVSDLDQDIFVFKSKKAAQAKIDSFYKSFLGTSELTYNGLLKNYQEKLGVSGYNEFIGKLFYQKVPKEETKVLKLIQKNGDGVILEINNLFPEKYFVLKEGEVLEEGEFTKDPDLRTIFLSFAFKKNLSLH